MHYLPIKGRTLALVAVLLPLLAVFVYVGLRSGPLAPVAVTVVQVQTREITPALFGIGTVQARYTHAIGPTSAGRLDSLRVDVGDRVRQGELLGEMDPIDLDFRLTAQDAAIERARAGVREAQSRLEFAQTQAERYEQLFAVKSTSQEMLATRRQELRLMRASLDVATRELDRVQAEREGLQAQRDNLRLRSPIDGLVVKRDIEPGTTVVAGQAVFEVIDPDSLWINTRFDQINATGIAKGQPADIALRSRAGQILSGEVVRIEPLADSVTEEMLAKVTFMRTPQQLPPIGELAEVTVTLDGLKPAPAIPNAAIRRDGARPIVWRIVDGELQSATVTLGVRDLDGNVQVLTGLEPGDDVVVYSESELRAGRAIRIVTDIAGVSK
ncbi:efflux RND transporter periplasmic adaptor subunit [Orrella marina]|uniref:Efflux transporter periplasmic adaptor subunit n=1 Tax=Orrella marina TaxID=2163011 RepID=A0A2R4XPY3_9BURK|nr:efflux transporter periplasmic adaptor subunit [Orrella marina]